MGPSSMGGPRRKRSLMSNSNLLEELQNSLLSPNSQRSQLGQDAYRQQSGKPMHTSSKLGGGGFINPLSSTSDRFGG